MLPMATLPALAYLALGDSYTVGEGVAAASCWPAQLVQALRQRGLVVAAPRIVAVTGWTTDELAAGIEAAGLPPAPAAFDLVTLQIGANDQYRGRPADDYRASFTALLARAVAFAAQQPGRVVVASIPDWGVTRFAAATPRDPRQIARELDDYNAIARAETLRSGAAFVDITALSRQYPLQLAADGLHPSATQYAHWVDALLPAVWMAIHRNA